MDKTNNFITYKGRPLVRSGDTIYYGSMADEYVVMMQITDKKTENDLDMSKKISLKLILTDESVNLLERIKRTAERDSLYESLDIADGWLTDTYKEK